jgi:DNA mismatch repair protein MutS
MNIETPKLTPMLRQYYEIKQTVGDAILFFRMGDFFEIFGEDAELIAPKLDVVLTAREKGDQTKIPFCGVPHHSAKGYWLKLVKLGYKVAICEQLEDAAEAKGLVKRGVTRVYSPGSLDDLEGLEQSEPNYLLAWMDVPGREEEVLAAIDVSTGEFRLGAIERGQLPRFVRQFRPSELLVRRFAQAPVQKSIESWMREHQLHIDFLPEAPLKDESLQRELLTAVFGVADLSKQPSGLVLAGGALVASVLTYFKSMNAATNQFMRIECLEEPDSIALSETVIRDLEIFETSRRRQTEGSLARVIDRTLSPMGARALRHALCHPLTKQASVAARHSAVGDLVNAGETELANLRAELKNAPDLARLSTRILAGSASPHELTLARTALLKANALSPRVLALAAEGSQLESIAAALVAAGDALAVLADVLIDQPEGLGTGRGVFRSGYDPFLDEKNQLAISGEERVARYEEDLRVKTGISSLKVRAHKSFGLLLEVTKSNISKVPASFIRRQTMTNGERYTTIELKELDDALASANEQAIQREQKLYQNLLETLKPHRDGLMIVARAIGELDLLQSFAWLALKENYTRPVLTDRPRRLTLKSCRHPVVEKFVGRHDFVPNDILMNESKSQILITGPNMAGKSTVMRQTAIAAILCQAGSWVPAHEAEMPIFDRVFTRVGASDDLSRGQSTFMVEMSEAAEILRHATNRSLVILDEVGRGTSTTDGLAIAASIIMDLADRLGCFTMFATHYHELVPMMAGRANVVPMQTQVIERADGIVFSHRLVTGASASSFGIEVAKLAGVPGHVIEMAKRYLSEAESHQSLQNQSPQNQTPQEPAVPEPPRMGAQALAEPSQSLSKVQKGLFGLVHEGGGDLPGLDTSGTPGLSRVVARLETVKIHRTTPLQALNILNELKSLLVPVQQRTLFDDEVNESM